MDPVPRYIHNLRGVAQLAGSDVHFSPYLRAALILLRYGNEALSDRNPYKPSRDGTALEPYVPGVDGPPLTIAGEINKLAHNTSLGRDAYGIHYRNDDVAGHHLGEELAILVFREERPTYPESVFRGFVFTRLDGALVEL